ncbi:MAG: helix-turn-helix domain-containing protein [Caulobacter sp.]|nr:helix-turn-helix domain-containing protein [Caulobacter sp.]
MGSSLAAYLRRARAGRQHRQTDAAKEIGVAVETIGNWETGSSEPDASHYPAIIRYLGYEPWSEPATIADALAAERRRRGLSIAGAAITAEVDEGTFRRWESGEWNPQRKSWSKIEHFLRRPLRTIKVQS